MSAKGELFVGEEVRDTFEKDLDKIFGKNKWSLYCEGVWGICDERLFPDIMEIEVKDYETDEKIGIMEVSIEKFVDDYGTGAFVDVRIGELLSVKTLDGKEHITQKKNPTNEVRILKEFIKEFNPIYNDDELKDRKYYELVDIVKEIVKEM